MDKERELFKEAYKKGENNELFKAKREKKAQNNGGLRSQYNANQQMTSLPSGTILVPMMPQSQTTNIPSQ
eukprot:1474381-Ditylum_brightwellii.AAC.1